MKVYKHIIPHLPLQVNPFQKSFFLITAIFKKFSFAFVNNVIFLQKFLLKFHIIVYFSAIYQYIPLLFINYYTDFSIPIYKICGMWYNIHIRTIIGGNFSDETNFFGYALYSVGSDSTLDAHASRGGINKA